MEKDDVKNAISGMAIRLLMSRTKDVVPLARGELSSALVPYTRTRTLKMTGAVVGRFPEQI